MQQLTRAHTRFKSFVSKQEDTNNTDQEQEHRALVKHTSAMWAHVARASGHRSDNCGHKTQKQTAPPPSSSPADRGQSFADCLALLFGTVCVSMSAFVRMHTSCHSWSLATPPTARPTAGCHWRVPAHSLTVWPECRGGGGTKTGPRAESASVNCHFLLSAYSLSCLFDPSRVYLCAYSPQKNPVFPTHLFFYRFVASKPTGQLDKKVFKSQFWAKSNAHITVNLWKVSGASMFRKTDIMIFFLCWAF